MSRCRYAVTSMEDLLGILKEIPRSVPMVARSARPGHEEDEDDELGMSWLNYPGRSLLKPLGQAVYHPQHPTTVGAVLDCCEAWIAAHLAQIPNSTPAARSLCDVLIDTADQDYYADVHWIERPDPECILLVEMGRDWDGPDNSN